MDDKKTRDLLISHYKKYPELKAEDIFKFLFHSSFGCDHLVSSLENAISYIKREYERVSKTENPETEELDGDYVRVHLSHLNAGLSAKTLGKMFFLSAKKEENGAERLSEKLLVASALVSDGVIKIDKTEFENAVSEWKSAGFSAVRHSETFREKYAPAYRVIAKRFADCLPIITEVDKAVSSGTAKVTVTEEDAGLCDIIASVYDDHTILKADGTLYVFPVHNGSEPTGIIN